MRLQLSNHKISKSTSKPLTIDINISQLDENFVQLVDGHSSPASLHYLVDNAWKGFKKHMSPKLCEEGVGGTYFMMDEKEQVIGVFKPQDEEPYSPNNPKGYIPKFGEYNGFKEGIESGEASIRECAAFLLDYGNFSNVPPTDLVICQHSAFYTNGDMVVPSNNNLPSPKLKLGSFQQFIEHTGDCEDLSPFIINDFPVQEVQKIALLDVRIFNCDRHGGNILYRSELNDNTGEDVYHLIPIDHGYSLPSTLEDATFVWQTWPQAKQKLTPKTKEYIESLDAEKDISMLKQKFKDNFREEHFRVIRITTMLLKKAALKDLTFFDLANIICRNYINEQSDLEKWVQEAEKKSEGDNARCFMDVLSELCDVYLLENEFAVELLL